MTESKVRPQNNMIEEIPPLSFKFLGFGIGHLHNELKQKLCAALTLYSHSVIG